MKQIKKHLMAMVIVLVAIFIGCSSDNARTSEKQDSGSLTTERGEHSRDSGEQSEGEESGTEYALNQTYDEVRNGVRLVMTYDVKSNSFIGTVENTTDKTLKKVRVEVHLSNGIELGPTTPINLEQGKKRDVKLTSTKEKFDKWTAHPEVGSGEAGHGEEDGENEREGSGEHEGEHN